MSEVKQFVEQARDLINRGFAIAWARPGEKRPIHAGWSTCSQRAEDYVAGSNLGIVNGWPSGDSVCVDLDTEEAWEKAKQFLPPTGMIDGRPGKPRSHWWYRVTDIPPEHTADSGCQAVAAANKAGKLAGPRTRHHFKIAATRKIILDFLGTGSFATVPPTVVGDESRIWYADGDPAVIPFMELWEAVERLAEACGWQRPSDTQRKARVALDSLPPAVSGEGGRGRTWEAARKLVNDFALKGEEAWPVFLEWNETCEPPWPEKELQEQLANAIEAGPDPRFPHGRGLRPTIQVGLDQAKTNDEAIRALLDEPSLYQRGGQLVHVVRSADDEQHQHIFRHSGSPRIVAVPPARLSEMLSNVAEWKKYDLRSKKEKKCLPPDRVVSGVIARGQWEGIRHLEAVVEVPVLRPDGLLLTKQGYDKETGLFYEPNCQTAVLPEPSQEDASKAAAMLLDLVSDFPFKSDEHKAAWLAYLLTPLARYAYAGPAPLALIEANVAGAGKGLLCEIVSLVVSGRRVAVSPASADDSEMRKVITSVVIAGDPMVVFDNVSGSFGCPALDAALTGTVWKDRVLGTMDRVELPLHAVWAATANNAELAGDLHRRILHIKLDSKQEYPEDRDDFKIKDLCQHVLDRRSELLGAALTVLRAFCVAGCPDMKLKPWGSFEGWSRLVRSAVVWAGFPDPNETRVQLRTYADLQRNSVGGVLCGVEELDPENSGVLTSKIQEWCGKCETDGASAMREALTRLGAKLDSPMSIAKALSSVLGRMFEGRRLVNRKGKANVTIWYLERLSSSPEG